MRPIQDDPLFLAFKREWEEDHAEPDPDRSMFVIAYALSALSGGVLTAVLLGIGAWVGGLIP